MSCSELEQRERQTEREREEVRSESPTVFKEVGAEHVANAYPSQSTT